MELPEYPHLQLKNETLLYSQQWSGFVFCCDKWVEKVASLARASGSWPIKYLISCLFRQLVLLYIVHLNWCEQNVYTSIAFLKKIIEIWSIFPIKISFFFPKKLSTKYRTTYLVALLFYLWCIKLMTPKPAWFQWSWRLRVTIKQT